MFCCLTPETWAQLEAVAGWRMRVRVRVRVAKRVAKGGWVVATMVVGLDWIGHVDDGGVEEVRVDGGGERGVFVGVERFGC